MEFSNVISCVKGSRGATPPLPYLGTSRKLAIKPYGQADEWFSVVIQVAFLFQSLNN